MKSIDLKVSKEKVTVNNASQEVVLSTYTLLKMTINKPNQNGYGVEEMMQRLKLLGLVENFKQFDIAPETKIEDITEDFLSQTAVLEIEDADFSALCNWVKEMRWHILSQFIVEFINNFKK